MKNFKLIVVAVLALQITIAAATGAVSAAKHNKKKKDILQNKPVKLKQQVDTLVPLKAKEQKPVSLYPEKNKAQAEDKIGLSVGIKAGGVGGLSGAVGDVSYSLSKIVPGAAIRGSVGYLTGQNPTTSDNVKMTTVNLDALYSVGVSGADSPVTLYVGGGFIYPFKVSNSMGAGAWGAHAYFGSKYLLQDSTSIYGELAYTGIKYQADEAAVKGVEALLGYSYSF